MQLTCSCCGAIFRGPDAEANWAYHESVCIAAHDYYGFDREPAEPSEPLWRFTTEELSAMAGGILLCLAGFAAGVLVTVAYLN